MIGNRPPNEEIRIFRVAGIFIANSTYVQIENLDIQRFYTGIDVSDSQQVLVRHNDIQDVLGIGIYLRSGDEIARLKATRFFAVATQPYMF